MGESVSNSQELKYSPRILEKAREFAGMMRVTRCLQIQPGFTEEEFALALAKWFESRYQEEIRAALA